MFCLLSHTPHCPVPALSLHGKGNKRELGKQKTATPKGAWRRTPGGHIKVTVVKVIGARSRVKRAGRALFRGGPVPEPHGCGCFPAAR
jgi:hypothetical protein